MPAVNRNEIGVRARRDSIRRTFGELTFKKNTFKT
jgi:hypothetical protein